MQDGVPSGPHAASAGGSRLFDLGGSVAVVTGGGRGIGKAIAAGLAAHGARIVIAGRDAGTLAATADELGSAGAACDWRTADVSREGDVVALRDAVIDRHGAIDILVNNAGIDPHYASLERTDSAEWHRIIATNLTGVFLCCRHLGEVMARRGKGSIINIGSVGGHVALRRQVPYCASKGGVEALTRGLALDWAERGVRVNAVCYAFIRTELTASILDHEALARQFLERTPMKRFGTVDEVAGAVVFLASPAASYVTGHSLMVDGGWAAG